MKQVWTAALFALGLQGCATRSENIEAAHVSPADYQHLTCAEIVQAYNRAAARGNDLAHAQNNRARADALNVAGGLLIFGPMMYMTEGDGADAQELARLQGEMRALEQVSGWQGCAITFPDA